MPKVIFRPAPTPPPFVPPGPANKFLTFTAKENGCRVGYIYFSEDFAVEDAGLNIEYSLDNGQTWNPYNMSTTEGGAQMISLNNGESVMFRGTNANLAYYLDSEGAYQFTKFVIEGQMAASGDITSLLNGIGGDVSIPEYCFSHMFYECTSLTQAPALPATTLANNCYVSMFSGCTSLMKAPALPATKLANSCYEAMFYECTSLTQAPSLPSTTLFDECYAFMFYGCNSLTQAPTLPVTTLANKCYSNMFQGCTSLTQAPALPATTLANNCYASMFYGCTSLTQAPALPATTLANNCYTYMFRDCTSLNHVECLATDISATNSTNNWLLNVASVGTFVKATSMSSWPSGANGIPDGWSVQDKS